MRTLILAAAILFFGVQAGSGTEPSWIVLKDGQTKTLDGFSIVASVGPLASTPFGKKPSILNWYVLSVPRVIGNTFLTACDLWVQDQRGHLIVAVSLVHSTGPPAGTREDVQVHLERHFAKQCEVHFTYGEKPMGNTAKTYLLPCSQIVASKPRA